jgi:hypothetical protein
MNKSTVIWALVALNVILVLTLVSRPAIDQPALAQVNRPGDYLMIPGQVVGGTSAVVYVLDQTSHQLGAVSYDDSMGSLDTMPPLNLDRVFASLDTSGGRGTGR